ncbi:MAG: S41 family peptidase [Pseudomonadota bacterium]
MFRILSGLSILLGLLVSPTLNLRADVTDDFPYNGGALGAAQALRDVAVARRMVQRLHAGYDRYTPERELASMWQTLESRAERGMRRGELYLELSRVLAAIRCDHTKAELPKDMAAERDVEAVYLPFRFVLFDRRMYVDVAAEESGLERGDEILAIDGRDVESWFRKIEPLVPVDGDAVHVIPHVMAYSTEFIGPALDHFAPFLAPVDDTVRLQLRRAGKTVHAITVPRLTYLDFQEMVGQKRYSANFSDSVRFERLGDDAAYLAVDTFVNYRKPVDPIAHLAPYFESLKAEQRGKLIVDLRRNGGGSNDAQTALLRYLIRRPVRQIDNLLARFNAIDDAERRYLSSWDSAALNPDPVWFELLENGYYKLIAPALTGGTEVQSPAPNAFDGDLIVLTGPGNSSGSTHLLAALKASGRATLVGERTGGAPTGATAGTILFLTLPESGIRVRIPAIRTVIANAQNLPARNGIAPDIVAPLTREAYFAGRDPALEVAMRMFD